VFCRIDCIGRVTKGEADLVILEPEGTCMRNKTYKLIFHLALKISEVYVAHRFFHDAFYVATEIRTTARQAGMSWFNNLIVMINTQNDII
jgi:hypothetical protein